MKLSRLKLIPVFVLSLAFAGCESMPGMSDDEQGGAPVSDAGSDPGAEGAQTSGAAEGAEWSGSELDNPDSLLYTKVIYFDYDVDQVREEYRDVVIAHGEYLASNPALSVTLEGHADERGSREYNIGLGERRANSVKRMLMAQGATESQIITISYGEERPASIDSNEMAWSQNRRAVFAY